jgi:DNA polymerase
MLVAGEGKEIVALDYAGIESRIVAWICGETWKLHAFELQDKGEGPDNYKLAFSRVFQVPIERVAKKQRQVGKVIELAMGFEGGIGALIKAFTQAGINFDELVELAEGHLHPNAMESAKWMLENGYLHGHGLPDRTLITLDAIKAAWRLAHPAIAGREAGGWKQLKDAAISAVRNPGTVYTIDTKLVHFKVIGDWLYLQLPSKRRIAYYKPSVVGEGREESLRYMGVDTEKRIWMPTATYGGKLMQNVAEGVGRDLLVAGMQALEGRGVDPIMCVHDEAVGEVDAGTLELADALKTFLVRPVWATGLPLAAEGFVEKRYRK